MPSGNKVSVFSCIRSISPASLAIRSPGMTLLESATDILWQEPLVPSTIETLETACQMPRLPLGERSLEHFLRPLRSPFFHVCRAGWTGCTKPNRGGATRRYIGT